MYKTKEDVMNRVCEHYELAKNTHDVFVCAAYGSWNYVGMSDDKSDVDTKCLTVPTFRDLALNKKTVSFTHVMENDEHLELKDVRLYFDLLKKQNPSFLEILFTDYCYVNPKYSSVFDTLKDNRELIAQYDPERLMSACLGQIFQKQKALTHRFGVQIDNDGYDGKQLANSYRILDMMKCIDNGGTFEEALNSSEYHIEFLSSLKRNNEPSIDKKRALELMEEIITEAQLLKQNFTLKDVVKTKEVDRLLEQALLDLFAISLAL